jgi:GTP-binding protein
MNFIDQTINFVKAGNGGNGMVSFRREKYVPYGGPSGGNGGNGGSVIFIGELGINTLLNLQYKKKIQALNGSNGQNKNKNGAKAPDLYIKVPLGTLIYNHENNQLIGEILKQNEKIIIAKGGKGGRGNYSLANNKNRIPKFAEKGDYGESYTIRVELKILADIGLVGFPNVGKSSLISAISNAKSKIDTYPFTTLKPFLGKVFLKENSFVIADIPGLIKDSHIGRGMGINFLKHIERCKILLFLLSIESTNPFQDYCDLIKEIKNYNSQILKKQKIIVLNKMDLPKSNEKLHFFQNKILSLKNKQEYKIISISVLEKKNLCYLTQEINNYLLNYKNILPDNYDNPKKIFNLKENEKFEIIKDKNGDLIISGKIIEKWFHRTDFNNFESIQRFSFFLKKIGIEKELKKYKINHKNKIKICNYIFEILS